VKRTKDDRRKGAEGAEGRGGRKEGTKEMKGQTEGRKDGRKEGTDGRQIKEDEEWKEAK
jgi:hypothetical protein